jgi:hypothetical protein
MPKSKIEREEYISWFSILISLNPSKIFRSIKIPIIYIKVKRFMS